MALATTESAAGPAPAEPAALPPEPHREAMRQLCRRLALLTAVVACLAGYVLYASLPPNALGPSQQRQHYVRLFVPEGWGFFTISPRRDQLLPMRLTASGEWAPADAGHLAVPADGFGANRIRRAQGTEMALLLRGVRAADWVPCHERPAQCLAAASVLGTVRNPAVHPTLCGPVGFVRQQPLPWAWRAAEDRTVMPSSVLRLEVSC